MKIHRKLSLIAFADSYHSVYTILKSWLILSLVTLTVPVIQGCDKHMHPQDGDFTEEETGSSVKLAVRKADQTKIRTLDAFVFNADPLKRLDCYQRYEEAAKEQFLIGSCAGEKIILLCANSPWEKVGWEEVQSLQRASSLKVDLEDEDSDYPVMSAQVRLSAGCDTSGIILERLTSEIELRSVRCDFSGKPYEGEAITDARAYLTNANATCCISPEDNHTMERIINHRSLMPEDVIRFRNPRHISDSLGTVNPSVSYPDIRFLCYPNTSTEESMGTPFTRLVIEGKIQGQTWYWPININRECGSDHEGISRNRRYVYDITIRSRGTKDPDTPIVPEMAETTFTTEKWEEKEPYHVSF